MTRPGRKLSPEEAAIWARVAETVTPIEGNGRLANSIVTPRIVSVRPKPARAGQLKTFVEPPAAARPVAAPLDAKGLDSSWDRKLSRGAVDPDFTLDLHGASLDAAHGRLMHGLAQAKAMGARVVLLVTGKPRLAEFADRGNKRGAIRAKVIDWLAHSEHALDIAAIRGAHRRHGGAGALYIILKKRSL